MKTYPGPMSDHDRLKFIIRFVQEPVPRLNDADWNRACTELRGFLWWAGLDDVLAAEQLTAGRIRAAQRETLLMLRALTAEEEGEAAADAAGKSPGLAVVDVGNGRYVLSMAREVRVDLYVSAGKVELSAKGRLVDAMRLTIAWLFARVGVDRIRVCRAEGCERLYYAKDLRQTHCEHKCSGRESSRRHRARHPETEKERAREARKKSYRKKKQRELGARVRVGRTKNRMSAGRTRKDV